MPRKVDRNLIGFISGDLTVIDKAEDKLYGPDNRYHRRQWLFLCSCGKTCVKEESLLMSGDVKSCGHRKHDEMVHAARTRCKNIVGQIVNNALVLRNLDDYIDKTGKHIKMIECECLYCHNIFQIQKSNLKHKSKEHCGKCGPNSLKDLTGLIFGDLYVHKRLPDIVYPCGSRAPVWECKCSCGVSCVVSGQSLREGIRTDCGHSKCSKAEKQIRKILNERNIDYIPEYTFSDLVSTKNKNLRFDFAIFVNNKLKCLIEYQGIQHYWDYQYGYVQREITDKIKKTYCKKNNIPLFEIKYDENIELKLIEILQVNSVPISA